MVSTASTVASSRASGLASERGAGRVLDDSASAAGGAAATEREGEEEDEQEDEAGASVVRLSKREQRAQQGRGAADEIWRQVMEPALGHWTVSAMPLLLLCSGKFG